MDSAKPGNPGTRKRVVEITIDPQAALGYTYQGDRRPLIVMIPAGVPHPVGTRWNKITDLAIATVRTAIGAPMFITETDVAAALKRGPKVANIGVVSGRKKKDFRSTKSAEALVFDMRPEQLNALTAEFGKLVFPSYSGSKASKITIIRVDRAAPLLDVAELGPYAVAVSHKAKDTSEMLRLYETWFNNTSAQVWPPTAGYLHMLKNHGPFAVVHDGVAKDDIHSMSPIEWPAELVDEKPSGLVLFTPSELPRPGSRVTVPSSYAGHRLVSVLEAINVPAVVVEEVKYPKNMQVHILAGLYSSGALDSVPQGVDSVRVVEMSGEDLAISGNSFGYHLTIRLTNESGVIWLSDELVDSEDVTEDILLARMKTMMLWVNTKTLEFLDRAYNAYTLHISQSTRALTVNPVGPGDPAMPLVRQEFWNFARLIGSSGGNRMIGVCGPPESGKSSVIRAVCSRADVPVGTGFIELESAWYEYADAIEQYVLRQLANGETTPSAIISGEFVDGKSMFSLAEGMAKRWYEGMKFWENDDQSCGVAFLMSHLAEFLVGRCSLRITVLGPSFLTDQFKRQNPLGPYTRKILHRSFFESKLSGGSTVQFALTMAEFSLAVQLARVHLGNPQPLDRAE